VGRSLVSSNETIWASGRDWISASAGLADVGWGVAASVVGTGVAAVTGTVVSGAVVVPEVQPARKTASTSSRAQKRIADDFMPEGLWFFLFLGCVWVPQWEVRTISSSLNTNQ